MRISRKVRISDALLIGVLFFAGGCASISKPRLTADAQAEALSHFSLGLLAESGGDSAAALDHLREAVRLDPREERLYAPAAAIAMKLNQPEEALRLARAAKKYHPDTIDSRLLLARVCALTDRMEETERLFRSIQSDFPDHPETVLFTAQFYISQDRQDEAVRILENALPSQSENPEILHLLGALCIEQARKQKDQEQAKKLVQQSIGFFKQTLELAPQDPLRWQQLSFAFLAVRQPEEALEALREARRYDPSDRGLAYRMFDLIIATGKYDEAIRLCEQLAEETSTDPEPWFQHLAEKMPKAEQMRLAAHLENQIRRQSVAPVFYYAQLGSLYIDAGKKEEAETILQEALKHYPADNRIRIVLGYLHLQQNRFDEAYTTLEQVRAGSPEAEWSANPFFLFNFLTAAQKSGHIEQAAGTLASTYTNNPVVLDQYISSLLTEKTPVSTENAISLLNRFRTLSPDTAETLYYLMILQAERKEYQTALETARQFEDLAQKSGGTNLLNASFYYQYGALHERTGDFEEAERQFLQAIQLGNETLAAASQNYIAYMWAERGEKLTDSLKLIQKALAVEPENGAFLDTLGWIYYMQGRYAEALQALQKASNFIHDDPTIWEHLGDTYLKLGDRETAISHWKKALELDPGNKKLISRLEEHGVNPASSPATENNPADTPPRP